MRPARWRYCNDTGELASLAGHYPALCLGPAWWLEVETAQLAVELAHGLVKRAYRL